MIIEVIEGSIYRSASKTPPIVLFIPAPIALAATNIGLHQFDANWVFDSSIEGYYLDVADNSTFSSFVYNNLNVGDVSTYTVLGLNSSTNYYYRLRAYVGFISSPNSNIIDTSTLTLAAPVATAATDVSTNSFVSNWNDVSEANGYYLYVSDNSTFSSYVTGFNGLNVANVSTYLVTGISANTTYYYRLKAYDNARTSDYSNIINTSTNIMMYTACATYSPYFVSVSSSSGFLSVGALNSSVGTIGNYVIEWRLNSSTGSTVFVSGYGVDPSIQSQHPVVNEVVFAGTLYPIIKYTYINSVKYTLDFTPGARYSPDFINCLNPVVITPIDCCTALGVDPIYPYYLSYNNAADFGVNKSRSLKYDICPSVAYLAWEFDAFTVPEQIRFYYCTSTNFTGILLDNFIHGAFPLTTNLYPANYPDGSARTYQRQYRGVYGIKYITDLTDVSHNTGDYVRIDITGSVYDPSNNNTNWDLKVKSLYSIDPSFYDSSISKIASIDPSLYYYADPACRYDVSYNTLEISPSFSKTSPASPFIWKYMDVYTYVLNQTGNSFINPINDSLRWQNITNSAWLWYGAGVTTNMNLSSGQTITATKDSSYMTFTFTDIADYNKFASNIASIKAEPNYTIWQGLSNTNVRYYAYYQVQCPSAASVGDNLQDYAFQFHLSADISYNVINKTIGFQFVSLVNNITDSSCDNSYEQAVSSISSINNMKITPWLPITTHVRKVDPVTALWYNTTLTHEMTRESFTEFDIPGPMTNNLVDLAALGFVWNPIGWSNFTNKWTLFRNWDRVNFTGNASTHDYRMKHWNLQRKMFLRTDVSADTAWEVVYDTSIA